MFFLRIIIFFLIIHTKLILAQSAFISHHGSVESDEYYNIVQFRNGNYIAVGYGGCRSSNIGSSTITLFDSTGKIINEWLCDQNLTLDFRDVVKISEDACIIGGTIVETSFEGNQHIIKMSSDGSILIDTFYSQYPGSGASLKYLAYDALNKNIFTVGNGLMPGAIQCLSIQKIDSLFHQNWYGYLCNITDNAPPKSIFYDAKHDELIIFTKSLDMLRVDAKTGNELSRINLFDLKFHDGGIPIYSDSYIQKCTQINDSVFQVCYSYNKSYLYNFVQYDRYGNQIKNLTYNALQVGQTIPSELTAIYSDSNGYLFYRQDEYLGYLQRLDTNFKTIYLTPWDTSIKNFVNRIYLKADGSAFGCGAYYNNYDTRLEDYFIFKTDQNGKVSNSIKVTEERKNTSYPNPADRIHILNLSNSNNEIRIYDSLGKEILLQQDKTINTENFENGTYFILIKDMDTNKFSSQKLVVLHR